jgi:hypothetical protein
MLADPNSPEAVAELPSQANDEVRVRRNYVPIGMGLTLRGHPKAANEGHLKTGQRK